MVAVPIGYELGAEIILRLAAKIASDQAGCFGEDRPGTDEDFDIVRNGTPAIPQPAWPDPTYPKVAKGGRVAGTFCIPPTNKSTINIPIGLGGPGAFILPGDACVGFLGQ